MLRGITGSGLSLGPHQRSLGSDERWGRLELRTKNLLLNADVL